MVGNFLGHPVGLYLTELSQLLSFTLYLKFENNTTGLQYIMYRFMYATSYN